MLFRSTTSDIIAARDPNAAFRYAPPVENAFGFRERDVGPAKPPGTYRIAVLGDSLTYGVGVPASTDRFTNLLERQLNERRGGQGPVYEVLNFGHPGWDTEQEVEALRRVVWQFEPDFVLLQWYINDFENGDYLARPRIQALLPWQALQERLYQGSHLYALMEEQWEVLQEQLGLVKTYPEYMYKRLGDPDGPPSMYAIDQLRAFFAACHEHDTPMAVVLFPHFDPSLIEGRYVYNYLHDRVLAVCRVEGLLCVDLRATFAKVSDYRTLWANRFNPHPSPAAHQMAEERLFEALGETWLTPSRHDKQTPPRTGRSRIRGS